MASDVLELTIAQSQMSEAHRKPAEAGLVAHNTYFPFGFDLGAGDFFA
ncbi:hypothetical protein QZN06_00750 [Burkholderia multivorans]|nr:hypothetical protein [Burkholderia multivorans]